jgi:hypothetical protein
LTDEVLLYQSGYDKPSLPLALWGASVLIRIRQSEADTSSVKAKP